MQKIQQLIFHAPDDVEYLEVLRQDSDEPIGYLITHSIYYVFLPNQNADIRIILSQELAEIAFVLEKLNMEIDGRDEEFLAKLWRK